MLERTPSFLRELRKRLAEGVLKREGWDTLAAWGLTAALGAALYPLYSSRMIPEENGKVYSGGSCWADLPIHMVSGGHGGAPVCACRRCRWCAGGGVRVTAGRCAATAGLAPQCARARAGITHQPRAPATSLRALHLPPSFCCLLPPSSPLVLLAAHG